MHDYLFECVYGITHHLLHALALCRQRTLQLKDGEEYEVNGATFTVCVNGAEQWGCTAYTVLGVVLCFGGLRVILVRNDIGYVTF